ncbi:hypothetical protein [Boseongicola sp. H5]|uniref:P-loop ATPase, Sll1717 family n=1 Tax=Boseongicola sp. H5 TaxID=2763261 RepID=UPI001D09EB68|nr:hypothetical protein [Boseongicola sp. H5]
MNGKDLAQLISLGASVAEFDSDLANYFIETETFSSVISDAGDIISGDKGTGKTAIYRILKQNYRAYESLESVEIVDAFNPQGDPVFQRLTYGPDLSEDQYRTFWKAYLLSLVGNWLIDIYEPTFNQEMVNLKNTLDHLGLSATDVSPETIFGNLHELVTKLTKPSSMEVGLSVTETGMPIVTPKVELGSNRNRGEIIYNGDFLSVLDAAIASTDLTVWVLFDRLDEAFSGRQEVEIPALRALMRTYLDLTNLKNLRLKLFLRKDLFRKITMGGFVNLTHINARKIDIVWDDEDLIDMVVRRVLQNPKFRELVPDPGNNDAVFSVLLPEQIDVGDRKPSTRTWIMGRIRDGNNNRPPRNMIDLLNKARESQLRREQRDQRDVDPTVGPIMEADAVKRAFTQLSEQRVQDTLLAEASDLAEIIQRFRDGKSEHNPKTLRDAIGDVPDYAHVVQSLVDIGFLEEFGQNHKIPMLYRDGLRIKQGKAFA